MVAIDGPIDKAVLATLPEDIRKEILSEYSNNNKKMKNRINKYIESTKPLSDFYKKNYPSSFHSINGNIEIDKIQEDIFKILENKDFLQ